MIEFEGTIATVERFVLRIEDGTDLEFAPADDLVFHGAPAGHIGEHRRTGIPVRVRYTTASDGTLIAEEIFDAG